MDMKLQHIIDQMQTAVRETFRERGFYNVEVSLSMPAKELGINRPPELEEFDPDGLCFTMNPNGDILNQEIVESVIETAAVKIGLKNKEDWSGE